MASTAPVVEPTTANSTTTAVTTQQTAIRKRRRRLTSNGAADDCFACQKRRIRCDRRRPYCTQCLDMGKDCSGYKTTLTWGVGVASRGKLRGLSLPIVNSTQKAAQADEKSDPKVASKSATQRRSPEAVTKLRSTNFNFGLAGPTPDASPMLSAASFPASAPIPIPTAVHNHSWGMPNFQRTHSLDDAMRFKRQSRPAPLQRTLSFSPNSFDDGIFSVPSTASVSNFSESDFPSPQELPPTPPEMPCNEPFINGHSSMDIFLGSGADHMSFSPAFAVDVSPSLPFNSDVPLNFTMDSIDTQCLTNLYSTSTAVSSISAPLATPATAFSDDFGFAVTSTSASSTPTVTAYENEQHATPSTSIPASSEPQTWSNPVASASATPSPTPTSIPQPIPSGSGLSSLSPRTAYLVDYYSTSICQVLVAVDGTNNPYRVHILALASASGPALVNAVAALASNVLHHRTNRNVSPMGNSVPGISEEALHYKTAAVNLYNAALRDPAAAYDDSILATLVVLSLLDISQSGSVAHLTSQMAEIRQILTLRGSNSSQFLHWATMFFTWLDIMKATVQDRERQLRTSALDLLDFSANLGALEHLSFCEGRMFKVLARMGSGSRTRRASMAYHSPTPTGSWTGIPLGHFPGAVQESRSRRPSINPFTGQPISHPMSSPVLSSEVVPTLDSIATAMAPSMPAAATPARPSGSDARQEFWSEWAHVRARLRVWSSRDPFTSSASGSSTPALSSSASPNSGSTVAEPTESALVTHASEVFRHAALIFAERLAFPALSPRSPQIQALVTGALHHVSSIPLTDGTGSGLNKTLLWPLCVIGTECVRPGDRDVVRLRCGEAMREPGVFAGMSGIDVLEHVWAVEDAECNGVAAGLDDGDFGQMPHLSSLGGQAGRWRRAMAIGVSVAATPVSMPVSLNMSAASVSGWAMPDLTAFV